jgi:hypothetical protein
MVVVVVMKEGAENGTVDDRDKKGIRKKQMSERNLRRKKMMRGRKKQKKKKKQMRIIERKKGKNIKRNERE